MAVTIRPVLAQYDDESASPKDSQEVYFCSNQRSRRNKRRLRRVGRGLPMVPIAVLARFALLARPAARLGRTQR